ncbi:unnamed protein product, partial [Prorocentrum cordatum]
MFDFANRGGAIKDWYCAAPQGMWKQQSYPGINVTLLCESTAIFHEARADIQQYFDLEANLLEQVKQLVDMQAG